MVTEATAVRFATAARVLGASARRQGLEVPGFRSPPRVAGATRALRRAPDGSVTVAVTVRGRPWLATLADMVDGVVAANGLVGAVADACRTELWGAIEQAEGLLTSGEVSPPAALAPAATVVCPPGWRNRQTQAA